MITHVAIRYAGQTYSLPAPNRHHNVIWLIGDTVPGAYVTQEQQGFLDDSGKFLGRREALKVALRCGQVKDPSKIRGRRLYSEDLW